MPNLDEIWKSAAAAEAAYAEFRAAPSTQSALANPETAGFVELEANRFLGIRAGSGSFSSEGFELRHHQPDELTGFSASVFFDRSTNRYVLAIRGTAGTVDLVLEDILRIGIQGYAADQAVSLYRYYRKLTTPTGQPVNYTNEEVGLLSSMLLGLPVAVPLSFLAKSALKSQLSGDVGLAPLVGSDASVIPLGAPVTVAGHSLGGHLALLFGRLFPEVTDHIYTYNAPGITPIGEAGLFGLGVLPISASRVTNVAAVLGNELISRIPSKPGEVIGIATEAEDPGQQHPIVPLTDTLALYDAIAMLSPGLAHDAAAVSGIISAASSVPSNSLEVVLDHLGTLLDAGNLPTPITADFTNVITREGYYQNLYAVLDSRVPGLDYQIESLVGKSVIQLASAAASDVSVRYSLNELMSFHAKNADYSEFEDSIFSGSWIASRSEMLEGLLTNNLTDRPYGLTGTDDSIVYRDVDSGTSFWLLDGNQHQVALPMSLPVERQRLMEYLNGASYKRSVVFGSDSVEDGDLLTGLDGGDLLFGGAGADSLDGGAGDDYLDGGAGEDLLLGGDGDDVLDGGDGSDDLEGGPGNDTYVFVPGLDTDSILDRDGEIYAGATRLTGGFRDDGGAYLSGDGLYSYEFSGDLASGGTLVINGRLRVENFRNEDLGIRLADGLEPGDWAHETDADLYGDFDHHQVEISPQQYIHYDPFGNVLPISQFQVAPDKPDYDYEYPGLPGNTHFVMGGGDDVIQDLYGGDDYIELGTGDDAGFGGRGDDLIEGGPGRDVVAGGRGNDFLYAGSAATAAADLGDDGIGTRADGGDLLSGGDGDDTIVGDAEANIVEGGLGNDRIFGGAGDDWIGADIEVLASQEQYDALWTISDYDIYRLGDFLWSDSRPPLFSLAPFAPGAGRTGLVGGILLGRVMPENSADGADWIDGGAGNDTILAGGGNDFVLGGSGDDFINIGSGADVVFGGEGNDVIGFFVNVSDPAVDTLGDYIDGGDGDDQIGSGGGDNILIGGRGNDTLSSHGSNDVLIGGDGNDTLVSGGAKAVLDGGAGDDFLACGTLTGQEIRFRTGHGYGSDVAVSSIGTMIVESLDVLPGELSLSSSGQEIVVPGFGNIGFFEGLRIEFGGGGDSLFLLGWNQVNELYDRRIEFSDGTVWDDAYIQSILDAPGPTGAAAQVFAGSGEGDLIYGTAGADTFSGGAGDDWVLGDAGDDIYLYAVGDGFDTIEDFDPMPGNSDSVRFAGGILPNDVEVFAQGDDYVLTAGGGGLRLRSAHTQDGAIERVEFSGGDVWSQGDLQARAEVLPYNRAPEMPSSFGSVSVDPGHRLEIALPQDAIFDPDRFDSVSLYAITADGERLPGWLQFDASSRTFAGTPSGQDAGLHEILVIAADTNGAASLGSLTIEVGGAIPAPETNELGGEIPASLPSQLTQVPAFPMAGPADAVVADVPSSLVVPASSFREDAFSAVFGVPLPIAQLPAFAESADPAFREIQHSTDVLLQTGRANLGERYLEAIREFEERRLQFEEAPQQPPPTDEEIEAWNAAMHTWHDRNPGFAEGELGGNDGTWGMGWGLPGPADISLGGTGFRELARLGGSLGNSLQGVTSSPALKEGMLDVR